MVRSHLDYVHSVWAPYKKGIIDQIESVQKRATKQIPALRNLSYQGRLQKLKLPTLAYRRGDLIEAYTIVHKKHDPDVCNVLKLMTDSEIRYSTRINTNKIMEQRFKTNIRKHSFAVRVAKICNKLPENITNTPFLNTFKTRLDRFMENEDISYSDFRAELSFKSGSGKNGNN
jgi:hypothetical protein